VTYDKFHKNMLKHSKNTGNEFNQVLKIDN